WSRAVGAGGEADLDRSRGMGLGDLGEGNHPPARRGVSPAAGLRRPSQPGLRGAEARERIRLPRARRRPRRRNVSVGSTGRRPGWPRLSRDPLALLPGHRAAEDVLLRISTSHPAVPTSRAGPRFTRTDPSCSVVLGRCELAELRFDRLATATERALVLAT